MNLVHLKQLHVICVILTFISFSIRGYWMIIESSLLQHRLTRILPHIIDTVLLLSGVSLAVLIYGEFYKYTWIMIKLGAVVVYIILGGIAIRYGKTKPARLSALVLAWCLFFYVIALAGYNSVIPMGVFGI
jgi:uncharacterized membrane protein SirB2